MTQKPTPEAINLSEIKRFDDKERRKMKDELAHDAFDHFKRAEILNEMRIKNYIENWKPKGE